MGISIIQVKNNENLLNLETKNFKKLKFKDFYYNHLDYMVIKTYDDTLKIISK